jgi:hypothetical protein
MKSGKRLRKNNGETKSTYTRLDREVKPLSLSAIGGPQGLQPTFLAAHSGTTEQAAQKLAVVVDFGWRSASALR